MNMTVATIDDAWMETCLIGISIIGGAEVQFAALTETVDFDVGDKDIEGVPILNGGRITKFSPEADTTITFEAYPVEAGTDSGVAGTGFFDLLHSQDVTEPTRIVNDHERDKYRVIVCWTTDVITTAGQDIDVDEHAFRIVAANGRFTSVKPSFTDGILKFTVIFKCPAFDKAVGSNVMMESTDGTILIAALNAYSTSNNW
jgi:hypothetical protein